MADEQQTTTDYPNVLAEGASKGPMILFRELLIAMEVLFDFEERYAIYSNMASQASWFLDK